MLVNVSSSFDESLGVCLTNPRKEWFGPIWVFRCLFNESKERKLEGFS
jgi:hypothetical protein